MKTRNLGNYFIAITVILCSLVLFSTLVFALSGFRLSPPGRTLQVDFRDVTGIQPGTPVRLAGKPAGRVIDIRHLTPEERGESTDPRFALRVTIELDADLPELTEDMRIGTASESFLGEKFVSLTPGALSAAPLADGAVTRATELGLMETVQELGSNLETLLNRLNEDYARLVPRVTLLVDRADVMLEEGTDLVANLNGAVTNVQGLAMQLQSDYQSDFSPRLSSILGQVQVIGTNVNGTISNLNTNTIDTLAQVRALLDNNQANLAKLLAELRVAAQNLKVITTYTKVLTGQLGQKPSRLIWGRRTIPLPTEQEILDQADPVEIFIERDENRK